MAYCDRMDQDWLALVDEDQMCKTYGLFSTKRTYVVWLAILLFATFDNEMATNTASIAGEKNGTLAQRRCIILAIIGCTPSSNSSLSQILQNGFLRTVKTWLGDILNGSVGGVDLLLHMLTHITKLPVTKSVVKDSGMGKAINSIEKHSICAGTPNEGPIKERIKELKDSWNKSVKALKDSDAKQGTKRETDISSAAPSPAAKKPRTDKASFSSLLKKVNSNPSTKFANSNSAVVSKPEPTKGQDTGSPKPGQKKPSKRVKWSDHFGGNLSASKIIDGENSGDAETEGEDATVSWSDRKKRDRLREKELLAKAKKSKLLDDDDDDMALGMTRAPAIQPTVAWHAPAPLPARPDVPPAQVNSKELATQTTRMASVAAVHYLSDYNVPSNPAPLSDVEQALDMASQTSAVIQPIPFFIPQAPPAPEPLAPPPTAQTPSYSNFADQPGSSGYGLPTPSSHTSAVPNSATAEFVQSLGLPMFLVGQNVQALQTLANIPGLLSTYVDGNGMYDQTRVTDLVQTLTQNIAPSHQQPPPVAHNGTSGYQPPIPASTYGSGGMSQQYGGAGTYGSASGSYGQNQSGQSQYGGSGGWQQGVGMKNIYRAEPNNGEGNLHLSGYGPSTTESDIINLFAPYVQVDEVVMKGTFCFVNTRDPQGAQQAREILNGALLGGAPVRINAAQRKNRDGGSSSFKNSSSIYGNGGGSSLNGMAVIGSQGRSNAPGVPQMPPMPNQPASTGVPAGGLENVRDDRGNPATKNLFVAGYGPGTTELQVRELFGQHCTIVGIIMKGTFSFVNTSDRLHAIQTREALSGTMLNGGVLRINFAKETGRLGTSFDLTYGGPGGGGRSAGPAGNSRYGRGGY
eukprot:scaffold880_cov132-Cylindrotheca_fusiformis.AAC.35